MSAGGVATSHEEFERLVRQRVSATATLLRERLHVVLAAGGPCEEVSELGRRLARLGDAEAAELLSGALYGVGSPLPTSNRCSYGWDEATIFGFGALALPSVEELADAWRERPRPHTASLLVSLMQSPQWVSPKLDAVGTEILSSLVPADTMLAEGGSIDPGHPRNHERRLWPGSLSAVAPRAPEKVGEALAAVADRRALFTEGLEAVEKVVDGAAFARVLSTVWSRRLAQEAPNAASAVVAAAERLVIVGTQPNSRDGGRSRRGPIGARVSTPGAGRRRARRLHDPR
jgi:hypothetical protein